MVEQKNPEITVIVPVYNAEKYLRQCLDSILSQKFVDFELVLVDDGSTDGRRKICDEYAAEDGRIRLFHRTNGGASSARNTGLDNATGKWIASVPGVLLLYVMICRQLRNSLMNANMWKVLDTLKK